MIRSPSHSRSLQPYPAAAHPPDRPSSDPLHRIQRIEVRIAARLKQILNSNAALKWAPLRLPRRRADKGAHRGVIAQPAPYRNVHAKGEEGGRGRGREGREKESCCK